MRSISMKAACMALALLVGSQPAYAKADPVAEATTGIRFAMENLLDALRRKAPLEEIAHLWYTDDLILAVSGYQTYQGLPSFMSTLKEWAAMPVCKWELEDSSVTASGNMAAAFVLETCEKSKMRTLYVFQKTSKGWRANRQAITFRP